MAEVDRYQQTTKSLAVSLAAHVTLIDSLVEYEFERPARQLEVPGSNLVLVELYSTCFLEAFYAAWIGVVPILSNLRRANPVQYAGSSGTSYCEVVLKLAQRRYKAMVKGAKLRNFDGTSERTEVRVKAIEMKRNMSLGRPGPGFKLLISAEDIVRFWPQVKELLAQDLLNVERVDAEFLQAAIATDPWQDDGEATPVKAVTEGHSLTWQSIFGLSHSQLNVNAEALLIIQEELNQLSNRADGVPVDELGLSELGKRSFDEQKLNQAIEFVRTNSPSKLAPIANAIEVSQSTFKSNYLPAMKQRGIQKYDGKWVLSAEVVAPEKE